MLKKLIYKTALEIRYILLGPKCKWPKDMLVRHGYKHYLKRIGPGYEFDINQPHLFTEKILWFKFNHNMPIINEITDKVTFKRYIEKELGLGYTIPLIGVWDNVKDFQKAWSSLPESFALKANLQGDGRNIKLIKSKSKEDFLSLKKDVKKWLNVRNTLLDSYDCKLFSSTPKVFAEELIVLPDGKIHDYKFLCFDGEPKYCYVSDDHFNEEGENQEVYSFTFFNMNWEVLNVQYGQYLVGNSQPPIHREEMINIARKLAKPFPFVRVDFFEIDNKVLISEMTFNPGGGYMAFNPRSFNEELGKLFKLPTD